MYKKNPFTKRMLSLHDTIAQNNSPADNYNNYSVKISETKHVITLVGTSSSRARTT